MFLNNSDNDPYGDLRRREEYERQQQANFARGLGNFLYRYIVYSMIWLFSSVLFSMLLNFILGWNQGITTIIGMVAGLFLFKISYIKIYPIKSLITIGFVFGLFIVAFS
ncbi:hypothetical protein KKG72_00040 [bacterium]|nr:hypothetical protein [bacterium]MBU1993403.1 hypothetical protein [bacterium]